ncbi:MAG TPA: ABC transporter ATP-binding protein [Lachnospiraceae bacterium]|nr:ABC transporter ATP-binding protein [Lachnospiraceae bacterium]
MPERRMKNTGSHMPGTGVNMIEKSRDPGKAYANLYHYIGKYKWIIFAAAVLSIAGAVLNLIGPSRLSEVTNLITDGMKTSIDLTAIGKIALMLCIFYTAGFILNYCQGFIMATVTQRIARNMRSDISKKINRIPLSYFDSHAVGDTLSRVSNDVDTFSQSMNQSFSTFVSSISLLLGSVLMMLLTNWLMALLGMAAAAVGMVLMTVIISRSQGYFSSQQTELGKIDGQIEEIYSGHNVVKVYNGEKAAKRDFHKMNDSLYECAWKSQFMSGIMMPLMIFIGNLAYVVVCITGAVLAVRGSITFGTIVAFMLYIRLFTQPLQNLSQAATSIQSMAAACERVFEFLDEKEMEDESGKTKKIADVSGNIEFKDVKFGYTPEKIIIRDFSARAKAGQKIAIVGPTGAGKTTMVNLLMRFYEINGGEIRIDGNVTKEIKKENLRDQFAMVLQDTWIFEGTIRENLVYNKKDVTDRRLDEVCEATGLTDFIRKLPKGYDTVISDQTSLSAGQKQLITIARAMLKDAPLLILDEATSSVDTRTEQKVQKAADGLMQGRTSFVIAHRLSTIKNADLILVMKDGDIIESGNHEELLKKNGFYASLYNSQFEQAS